MCGFGLFFRMEGWGRNNFLFLGRGEAYFLVILLCDLISLKLDPPLSLNLVIDMVYRCKGLIKDAAYHLSITLLHFLTVTVDSSRGYSLGRHRNPIIERAKVRTVKMTFFIVLGKLSR